MSKATKAQIEQRLEQFRGWLKYFEEGMREHGYEGDASTVEIVKRRFEDYMSGNEYR